MIETTAPYSVENGTYGYVTAPAPVAKPAKRKPAKPAKLSASMIKTLKAIAARGGEVNGYAGQPGMSCSSQEALETRGLLERVATCATCEARYSSAEQERTSCQRPLAGQSGGDSCYLRRRLTDAGRAVLASL